MAEKANIKIKLRKVRISYPNLFKPKSFGDEGSEPKYSAVFLIDPETKSGQANLEIIEDAIAEVKSIMWRGKKVKLKGICLNDGDDKEDSEGEPVDGYEGQMYLTASNSKKPVIMDIDRNRVEDDDGMIYGGCYVHAIVTIWGMDNKYGRRVCARVDGVMFAADGEAFGGGSVTDEDFAEFDEKPAKRKRRRDDDEDDDDKPTKRKKSKSSDDDEDEKPVKRKRRSDPDEDDSDDEDERPSKRRKPKRPAEDDEDDDDNRPSKRRKRRRDDDEDDDDFI